MSNSTYVSNLIVASEIFTIYSTYINFGFGLIGSLLNILVFTNLKIFRHNRCAFYLIVESIVDIGQLTQNFVNQIWALSLNGVQPANVSLVWCKLKNLLPQWCRLMLASIVCFAAIDQFLSTNPVAHLRQLGSLKLARCQIFFAILLWLLHSIPYGIFLHILPLVGCGINNTRLSDYYSFFYYPVLNGLLPILVSSIFSVLAYRNVRCIISRQIPIERRRLDQQLTAMIFVRVISFVLLQLPFTIYRIRALNVTIIPGNTIAYATNQWFQAVSTSLVYLSHAVILSF
jgi:hypothetical protein